MISIKSVRLPRSTRMYFLRYTTQGPYNNDYNGFWKEYFGTTTATTADQILIVVLELLSFDVLLFYSATIILELELMNNRCSYYYFSSQYNHKQMEIYLIQQSAVKLY
jgi:hypothetical protein